MAFFLPGGFSTGFIPGSYPVSVRVSYPGFISGFIPGFIPGSIPGFIPGFTPSVRRLVSYLVSYPVSLVGFMCQLCKESGTSWSHTGFNTCHACFHMVVWPISHDRSILNWYPVPYRFHTGFMPGVIVEIVFVSRWTSEAMITLFRFGIRFHTGFIPGFIPNVFFVTRWPWKCVSQGAPSMALLCKSEGLATALQVSRRSACDEVASPSAVRPQSKVTVL